MTYLADAPPLRSRPLDLLIVIYFTIYWLSVMMTDLHNFTASLMGLSVEQLVERGLPFPPRQVSQMYLTWAREADPLLYRNPPFFQVMEWANLLVLMPFSLAAVYAFVRGRSWVRQVGLMTQSFTVYSVLLCLGTTLSMGGEATLAFTAVYLPFLVLPVVVVIRLWQDQPFSPSGASRRLQAGLLWVGGLTLLGSLGYQGAWLVRHL